MYINPDKASTQRPICFVVPIPARAAALNCQLVIRVSFVVRPLVRKQADVACITPSWVELSKYESGISHHSQHLLMI